VTGEVIEIIFLGEDVGLGEFLAAGKAFEDDGAFTFHGQGGAAGGVDGVGLAFAALLGGSKLHGNQEKGQSA